MHESDLIHLLKKKAVDIGLNSLYILSMGIFIFECFHLNMIPTKFLVLIIAALLILAFILVIIDLLNYTGWVRIVKRACSVVLSVCLCFGSFFMWKVNKAFGEIDNSSTTMTHRITVMVPVDSTVTTLAELSGGKIGYQEGNDVDNANYVIDQLLSDETLVNPTYEAYGDYLTLSKDVLNGTLDAMIFTASYASTLNEQIEDFSEQFRTIASFDRENDNTASQSNKDISKEPFTIYISGMDEVGEPTINLRSDVNLLLMVNPLTNHIEMVSIPRDAYVPNTAANNYPDKLTHTGIYGIDTTITTMEKVFGFTIDYYAKVSFTSLIEIVDTLGGIDVNVGVTFCEQDENRSFAAEDLICLNAGEQTLNGKQALAYARHRKSYGDIERTMAQQEIIKGIINKTLSAEGLNKIPELLEIGPKYVSTNIPMDLVKRLIKSEAEEIQPWTFETIHMENGYSDMYPTASMGADLPLSVYILNREDARNVYRKYLEMYETMKLDDFHFDLNDLSDPIDYPIESPYMIWTDNVGTKIYQFYSLEYPTEEEENPDATGSDADPSTPSDTDPDTPIDPTNPEVPTEPSDPSIDPNGPTVDPQPEQPIEPVDPTENAEENSGFDPNMPLDPTVPLDPTSE